jgi:hypothetical protein
MFRPRKPSSPRKFTQSVLLVAACALAAVFLFGLLKHHFAGPEKTRSAAVSPPASSGDKSVIRGLRYSAVTSDGARIHIDADAFRVGKKKIGFLRVSLVNEAEIRNARIRIVREPAGSAPQGGADPSPRPQADRPRNEDRSPLLIESAKAVLKEMETSRAFPGMSSTRIVSVKIAPIDFQIFEEETSLLKISAGQAGFDLRSRKIVFRDGVRASSGNESWTGDELSVDPQSGRVTGRRRVEQRHRKKT